VTKPAKVFQRAREAFREQLTKRLEAAEPLVPENVEAVEQQLMADEVVVASKALKKVGPSPHAPGTPYFVRQTGTTCMSVSLANGLISLGEPCLLEDPENRVSLLADDVVASTSSFGKPGEYRSVDDLFKYLESGRLKELELAGKRLAHDYRVRLTCSLIDVCEALWTGRGRLVVQRRAHARLAFAIDRKDGKALVRVRDPMSASSTKFDHVDLTTLRTEFLWSPLKKLPRILGPMGLPKLTAKEALGHLDRYDTMENLGVDCPSALVYRAEHAPRLFSPPEKAS